MAISSKVADPPGKEKNGKKDHLPHPATIELIGRCLLALLAIAALALAAVEEHEAIGTALVGAAVAFGLAAAFFDRVVEVSTTGVKLRDYRALQEAAEREAAGADPEEKEALIARGSEVLVTRRSVGEKITPDQAVREARLTWQRNGLAVEMRFALWLQEHGWAIQQAERWVAISQPDLLASKEGRLAVIEVKVGTRPIGAVAVQQVLSQIASLEAVQDNHERQKMVPVLVLGEVELTHQATKLATQHEISVYLLDAQDRFNHLLGPSLED